jgi:hypothetical protein
MRVWDGSQYPPRGEFDRLTGLWRGSVVKVRYDGQKNQLWLGQPKTIRWRITYAD